MLARQASALPIQCNDFLSYAVWAAGPTTGSHGKPRATLQPFVRMRFFCKSVHQVIRILPALPCLLQQVLMLGARRALFWERQSSPFQMKFRGGFSDSMHFNASFLRNTFEWSLKMFWASPLAQCFCREVAGRSYAFQIQVLNSAIYESQQHDNFRRRSTNDSKRPQHL